MEKKHSISNAKMGVILYHYPLNKYQKDAFLCMSIDGKTGIIPRTQKKVYCTTCEFNKFGSGIDGKKACYQSRILLFYHNNKIERIELKSEEIGKFSIYVMRLLSNGRKTCSVVTEVYEKDGIKNYRFIEELSEKEIEKINQKGEKIKWELMKD